MKVLILEDNLNLTKTLKETLLKLDYSVQTSSSWFEAENLIQQNSFDVLVLDIMLPDKQGSEILNILAQKSKTNFKKILLISGIAKESQIKIPKQLKTPCVFFKKPLDMSNFLKHFKSNDINELHKNSFVFDFFFESKDLAKPIQDYFLEKENFDPKELVPLLYLAHLKKFSGELQISTDSLDTACIYFYKGTIFKSKFNNSKLFFGDLLIEYGLCLQENIQELLRKNQNSKKKLGEMLLEKKLLNPEMLDFVLKEQIKIRLSEIMNNSFLKLKCIEDPSLQIDQGVKIDFSEIDFIKWLIAGLQTEFSKNALDFFYVSTRKQKIKKIAFEKNFIYRDQFLQEYEKLFQNIKDNQFIEDVVKNSKNKTQILKLLYFGFITRSLCIDFQKPKKQIDLKSTELLVNLILKSDSKNLFEILQLPWSSSEQEIKDSYKNLTCKLHPDVLNHIDSESLKQKAKEAFSKVMNSYKTLENSEKRQAYIKQYQENDHVDMLSVYEKGMILVKEKKFKQAQDAFSTLLNHKQIPKNIRLYILLCKLKSETLNLLKNKDLKIEINQEIDSVPTNLKVTYLFWHVKGLFYMKVEQYETAIDFFKKTLLSNPQCLDAKIAMVQAKNFLLQSRKKSLFDILFRKKAS